MSDIYIEVVVDALGIIEANYPTRVDDYVYMVGQSGQISGNNGISELTTTCNVNDVLMWHVVAFDGTTVQLIENPNPGPAFDPTNGYTTDGSFDDGSYSCKASSSCTNQIYRFSLKIDDNSVQTVGWDPYLTISD